MKTDAAIAFPKRYGVKLKGCLPFYFNSFLSRSIRPWDSFVFAGSGKQTNLPAT